VRAPIDTIPAPPIPKHLQWLNVATLRLDQQIGRPVLVEFWDFCRAHSLRTLPYVRGWHDRYAAAGLRVISAHAPGYEPARDPDAVRAAVARLGIEHPVVLDPDFELWRLFGNEGWPARYLFDATLRLHSYHYGEGGYDETEAAIAELLGADPPAAAALRPEDAPGAVLAPHTPEQAGAWSGAYEAGGVWAVLDGSGAVRANGTEIAVAHPGAYALIEHERHTAGVLELDVGDGVRCHAVQFTPGLA
jgi:hypothetical protein